jgi:biotin synthase
MNINQVEAVFKKPLKELIASAHLIHLQNFPRDEVQLSTLLSIKTGGCPENCAYCPQSAHYQTGTVRHKLLSIEDVRQAAMVAKEKGSTRFCMGAAWREVQDGPAFDQVLEMIGTVKALNLEVCCTLGMLNESQARRLKKAGLHAYNHNIDTSRNYYSKIISTRTFDDRLRTIEHVRSAGLTVCTGGIIGMGETDSDRIDFLFELASMAPHPESVTINALIPIRGTPLEKQSSAQALDLARVIATARHLMPKSMIRLSAGRSQMSEEGQFLCFLAGANSIFSGDRLLTSKNPSMETDRKLLQKTGLNPMAAENLV